MSRRIICYAAKDEDGYVYLYQSKPTKIKGVVTTQWQGQSVMIPTKYFPRFLREMSCEHKPVKVTIKAHYGRRRKRANIIQRLINWIKK